jgi:signal transduction histidine kinase
VGGVAGPKGLRQLLNAVQSVAADLDLPAMLRRITAAAVELVDARYGALGVLDEAGQGLKEFITVGLDDDQVQSIGNFPEGHGILGLLIVDAKPLRLPDLTEHPKSYGFPPHHPPMRSFLGVPILVRDEVFGNLYLTDKTTADVFTDVDEELVVGLAGAAGVAIENARLVARIHELAVVQDRERIARDLHDTVIQRLFATGMSLQSTVGLVRSDPDAARTRINRAVDDLDVTIKEIRTAIFDLERHGVDPEGVRSRVVAVVRESASALGFEPRLTFEGPVDAVVVGSAADALVTTLREALSNVARHAEAGRVDIDVVAGGSGVQLRVVDDGIGARDVDQATGHGVRNMRQRATDLGGSLTLTSSPGAGTAVEWWAPLR